MPEPPEGREEVDDIVNNECTQTEFQQQKDTHHQTMELIKVKQELSLLGMILLDNDGSDKGR